MINSCKLKLGNFLYAIGSYNCAKFEGNLRWWVSGLYHAYVEFPRREKDKVTAYKVARVWNIFTIKNNLKTFAENFHPFCFKKNISNHWPILPILTNTNAILQMEKGLSIRNTLCIHNIVPLQRSSGLIYRFRIWIKFPACVFSGGK